MIIGYVILTDQPNGSWQPDWDGLLHVERNKAVKEATTAQECLGREGVRLAEVRWHRPDDSATDDPTIPQPRPAPEPERCPKPGCVTVGPHVHMHAHRSAPLVEGEQG